MQLTLEETTTLTTLLSHKLRAIPTSHLPPLTLSDILARTSRTHLANIPPDINLAFLLRHRSTIDAYNSTALKDESGQDEDIARAVWFYRLDPVRQFQRWQDGVRWNLALLSAVVGVDILTRENGQRGKDDGSMSDDVRASAPGGIGVIIMLSPAAARFAKKYLAAVLEHHCSPTTFEVREEFVRVWRGSRFDLFAVERAWARKTMQRAMRQLSREWEAELTRAREEMGREKYEECVEPFVGSLVPGRAAVRGWGEGQRAVGGDEERCGDLNGGNELLEALRVPCPVAVQGERKKGLREDEEGSRVCDLRVAIACVQSVRPRDMLPVLMRLFPLGRAGK